MFGSMMGNGGLIGGLQRMMPGPSAPQVPADGAMQPTIGPGATPAAAPAPAPVKMGMPQGGILGLLQGQSPQGLVGLLQRYLPGAGGPLAGKMPAAGMLPPLPGEIGTPTQGPVAPPQLPMNIDPMNQF